MKSGLKQDVSPFQLERLIRDTDDDRRIEIGDIVLAYDIVRAMSETKEEVIEVRECK